MSDYNYEQGKPTKGYHIAVSGLRIVVSALVAVLIIILIIIAARKVYSIGYEAFDVKAVAASAAEGQDISVTITKDMSIGDIAQRLIYYGLIDETELSFRIQAKVYGYEDKIIPGIYVLNTSMTPVEMLEVMCTAQEEEE